MNYSFVLLSLINIHGSSLLKVVQGWIQGLGIDAGPVYILPPSLPKVYSSYLFVLTSVISVVNKQAKHNVIESRIISDDKHHFWPLVWLLVIAQCI